MSSKDDITIEEAIEVLTDHNRWRRADEDIKMPHPEKVGIAIDKAIEMMKDEEYDDYKDYNIEIPPIKNVKTKLNTPKQLNPCSEDIENAAIFSDKSDCIRWVWSNMPFAIEPYRKAKTKRVSPFRSKHAMRKVAEHLGKMLHKEMNGE